jgi:hypothetical protein
LVIPIWVGGKANIQLDSSDGSVLRLGERRALEYPAEAQRDLRFLGQFDVRENRTESPKSRKTLPAALAGPLPGTEQPDMVRGQDGEYQPHGHAVSLFLLPIAVGDGC